MLQQKTNKYNFFYYLCLGLIFKNVYARINLVIYGKVAQLVRAHGSYP